MIAHAIRPRRRRRLGALSAAVALTWLPASPAWAEEAPPPGKLGLSLGAAAARFEQASGSSPPCCYEREDWITWGPEIQARGIYRAKPWLLPSLELGFGFLTGSAGEPVERLRISQRTLRASPMLAFHFGERFFVEPRLALHAARIDGRFEQDLTFVRTKETTNYYLGAGLGLSLGIQLKPRWAFALDAHRSFLLGAGDANGFDGYGAFVRYSP